MKTKQEKSQEEPIASSSSSRNSSFNKNRWSQISSSDTTSATSDLLNDDDANPCHLINSRRLSASGMTSLLFTPTTSLGLNTMRYWDTKNEQDDVFLSSTYGPISPINMDTNEASSKDTLSTTSSSYFSARSSCSSDSTNIKQHPEEQDSHISLYDCQNNSTSHNENISDKNTTTTTGHHTMRSTLLSKAMLLADTSQQQQQQHYPSVGTIGIGNLSSVLSKQWVLHSMRAIKPTNNSNHRAPIPAMLQQPSSTERSTVSISFSWLHVIYINISFYQIQRSSTENISLSNKDFTYIKDKDGHVTMILETKSRCKCVVVAGTRSKLTEKLADDSVQGKEEGVLLYRSLMMGTIRL